MCITDNEKGNLRKLILGRGHWKVRLLLQIVRITWMGLEKDHQVPKDGKIIKNSQEQLKE